MNNIQEIEISKIIIFDTRRTLKNVDNLVKSINTIGLQNPVCVRKEGDFYRLISGYHRIEACKKLGWEKIDVSIKDLNDIEVELAEIDENLIRNELTVLECGEALKRSKELHEAIHPETKHGGTPGAGRGRGKVNKDSTVESLLKETDSIEVNNSKTNTKQSCHDNKTTDFIEGEKKV